MSEYEPPTPVNNEIVQALQELSDMGLVEIVGITPDGDWLYASTEAGKKVLDIWED